MGRLKPLSRDQARLEAAGFLEVTQKGSHIKFVRQGEGATDVTIVPRKHEVPVGTLRSILSQAHIDPKDWDELG